MTKQSKVIIIAIGLVFLSIAVHLGYLHSLSANEKYPGDEYLLNATDKSALIIVAHDDDMAGSSGTMSLLCRNGWKIREMCFYQQGGLYREKDSLKNPIRKKSLAEVAQIQGLQGTDPVDFNFRNDMETEKSYMPMPYSQFHSNYKLDSLRSIISKYIHEYKPSVIFTLDDLMGGYGHPDHVLISQLIVEYCRMHKNDSGFTVRKIYQPVFPPSLAERVLGKMPVYNEARKVYQCSGMPLPDVQVDITEYARQKKQTMLAYTTEQNSLTKIWPYYNWYPSWLYFRIFDRDFFRVVDVSKL